jgi:hypothetical protein
MARRNMVLWQSSCRRCRKGLHACTDSWNETLMRNAIHSLRRRTKLLLKTEQYDKALDVVVSVGYTD